MHSGSKKGGKRGETESISLERKRTKQAQKFGPRKEGETFQRAGSGEKIKARKE